MKFKDVILKTASVDEECYMFTKKAMKDYITMKCENDEEKTIEIIKNKANEQSMAIIDESKENQDLSKKKDLETKEKNLS